MSLTPAPPASPVLSLDGATPYGIPFRNETDGPKVVTKFSATEDQPRPQPADLVKVFLIFLFSDTLALFNELSKGTYQGKKQHLHMY